MDETALRGAESSARSFLKEVGGYTTADSVGLVSSKVVSIGGHDTQLREFLFADGLRVWVCLPTQSVTTFWNEEKAETGPSFFESEEAARRRVAEAAAILGLSDGEVNYKAPNDHGEAASVVSAIHPSRLGDLPVFGQVHHLIFNPHTGRLDYYAGTHDYIVEDLTAHISEARAQQIAIRETKMTYGSLSEPKVNGKPEFGLAIIPGQLAPPYKVRRAWRIGLTNCTPYEVSIDATTGKPIGWRDTGTRF